MTFQYLAGAPVGGGLTAECGVGQTYVLDDLGKLEVHLQQQVLTPPAHHTAKYVQMPHFLTFALTTKRYLAASVRVYYLEIGSSS